MLFSGLCLKSKLEKLRGPKAEPVMYHKFDRLHLSPLRWRIYDLICSKWSHIQRKEINSKCNINCLQMNLKCLKCKKIDYATVHPTENLCHGTFDRKTMPRYIRQKNYATVHPTEKLCHGTPDRKTQFLWYSRLWSLSFVYAL